MLNEERASELEVSGCGVVAVFAFVRARAFQTRRRGSGL